MARTRTRKPYVSLRQQRQQRQDRLGMILIALEVVALVALITGAYQLDKARGMTVAQSLVSAGL